MIGRILFITAFYLNITSAIAQKIVPDTIEFKPKSIINIGFGSCFHQDKDYSIWNTINNDTIDLWIWLGDNVYGDTDNMDSLEIKYNKLKHSKEYSQLRNSTPIIGTWDDHDYGANDAGKELTSKSGSANQSLEFMDVPKSSERWNHDGIYGSYILKGLSTRVILLDLRYFKDDLKKKKASILGRKQWKWLRRELKQSTEDYNIICSSLQFVSNQHKWENWEKYGKERQKLIRLITKHTPANTIILSGDRHRAEISEYQDQDVVIRDITSSSLNSPGTCVDETNDQRKGTVICGVPNYGILTIDIKTDSITVYFKNQTGVLQTWNMRMHGFEF